MEASGSHSVAEILQRCTSEIVERWLVRARENKELNGVSLTDNELTGYLPKLIEDLIIRLKGTQLPAVKESHCSRFAALVHGNMRKAQGYTAGMLVDESRMLEVTISETLQSNRSVIDFRLLLPDVITIADEVDSQLAQAMNGYMNGTLKTVVA
jgi:hypothetical protein